MDNRWNSQPIQPASGVSGPLQNTPTPGAMTDSPVAKAGAVLCDFGRGIGAGKRPRRSIPALLRPASDPNCILVQGGSVPGETIPLQKLSLHSASLELGVLLLGPAPRWFAKPPCIRVAPEHLEHLIAILPEGNAIRRAAQSLVEGRDFLAHLTARKNGSPVVATLATMCVIAFILQIVTSAGMRLTGTGRSSDLSLTVEDLMRQGAQYGPAVMAGEWHRLLVSGFLHAGVMHLLMNMMALLQIGPFCERLMGSRAFLFIYLTCLLCSSWLGVALRETAIVSVGASGAIFGVIGMMLGAAVRGMLPKVLRRKMYSTAIACVIYQGFIELVGLAMGGSGVDQIAHGTGLVVGFIAGVLVLDKSSLNTGFAPLGRLSAICSGLLVSSLLLGFVSLPARFSNTASVVAAVSCLDEAEMNLNERDRKCMAWLEKSFSMNGGGTSLRTAVYGTKNPYLHHMLARMIAMMEQVGVDVSAIDDATIEYALAASVSCPESHAAWLWLRATRAVRIGDAEAVRQTVGEAIDELRSTTDGPARTMQLSRTITILSQMDFDPRLADLSVQAWRLIGDRPEFQQAPEYRSRQLLAVVALGMSGDRQEAAKVATQVQFNRLDTGDWFCGALALYLLGDAAQARPLLAQCVEDGTVPDAWWDTCIDVLSLPDGDAVERIRAECVSATS